MSTFPLISLPSRSLFYHGTSISAARSICQLGFQASKNSGDWLGDGVYFFDVYRRAESWARRYHHNVGPAVITVEVDLTYCMDLSDPGWAEILHRHADRLLAEAKESGITNMVQNDVFHGKDSYVINSIVEQLGASGFEVTCVKGLFASGDLAYPGSALALEAHLELAVRDTKIASIIAVEHLEERDS